MYAYSIQYSHRESIECLWKLAIFCEDLFAPSRFWNWHWAILAGSMALDSIEKLSDDDGPPSPPKKTTKSSPSKKVSPKAKPKTSAKNKTGKPKDSSAASPSVPKPKPKATLKRPASALPTAAAGSMSKPAAAKGRGKGGKKGKNPDHVSVCKSKYKSTGVWSIKLWQKEVCRVLWWQYFKQITCCNYLKNSIRNT